MKTILTNLHIVDPERTDIFIGGVVLENGMISEVFEGEGAGEDCHGAYLAPGIVDVGVKIGEPGARHLESFRSASNAALAGGVTSIIMRPDTNPSIDSPETLAFVRARAQEHSAVHIHISGTITKNRDGQNMSEIGFLQDAGAIAFSDGDRMIVDSKIALRAYQYLAMHDAMVIGHIQEPFLSKGANASSGPFATKMGLSSVSPLAEKIGLQREMALVEMANLRYHIDQVTTESALPVLERAKSSGLDVTAGASMHHITLNALDIGEYRTFFKFKPPLRSEEDRLAVIDAMKSGLIDFVSSMHTPQDEESKRLPFDEAASGAIGLETLLVAMLRLYHDESLSLNEIFRLISLNPARRFGLEAGRLKRGAPADLVMFYPDKLRLIDRAKLQSKAKNTPFDQIAMQGQIVRTYVAGEALYNQAQSHQE